MTGTITPNTDTAREVARWLNGLPRRRNAIPVKVAIKGEEFYGARYESVGTYSADMTAVREGRRKAGDEYIQDAIYLVGKLPKCRKARPEKTCFPFGAFDWYVAFHSPDTIKPEFAGHHPFGHSFGLMPWTLNESIDHYEEKPYSRFPMTVETIG